MKSLALHDQSQEWPAAEKGECAHSSTTAPVLLLPTGVAQLATMIATLRQQGCSEVGAKVLAVLPFPHAAMEKALRLCCALWKMSYVGNFSTPIRSYKLELNTLSPDEVEAWRRAPAGFVSSRLVKLMPALSGLQRHFTVTQARPNMIGDFFTLSALNPVKTLLVADGTNAGVLIRRHAGPQWVGFNPDLASFPTASEIWCHPTLVRNINEIGVARALEYRFIDAVYAELAGSELGKHFIEQVVSLGNLPRAIILSEHVGLVRTCTPQEEFDFHAATLAQLASRGLLPVLFKRHPREPLATTEKLRAAGVLKADQVIVTDDLASCVPIECLAPQWRGEKLTILSCYSTALVTLRDTPGCECACVDAACLPPGFRKAILDYSARHQLPRWELPESLFGANGAEVRLSESPVREGVNSMASEIAAPLDGLFAQARSLVAQGRESDAGAMIVQAVRAAIEMKDQKLLLRALLKASEDISMFDSEKSHYFLGQAEKLAAALGVRCVASASSPGRATGRWSDVEFVPAAPMVANQQTCRD